MNAAVQLSYHDITTPARYINTLCEVYRYLEGRPPPVQEFRFPTGPAADEVVPKRVEFMKIKSHPIGAGIRTRKMYNVIIRAGTAHAFSQLAKQTYSDLDHDRGAGYENEFIRQKSTIGAVRAPYRCTVYSFRR